MAVSNGCAAVSESVHSELVPSRKIRGLPSK